MVDTIKFSQMTAGGDIANDDKVPGLLSGANVLFNNPWTFLPPGTTAERPTPSSTINYRLRFNTEEQLYEYYDAVLGAWTQLQESAFTVGPFITYTADTSLPGAQNLGLLANGILKQTISSGSATLNIAVNDTDYYGPGMTGYLQAPAGVKDSNGNIVLGFSHVGSAVNYLNIKNSAIGNSPILSALGTDTDIGITLLPKGDAGVGINTQAVSAVPLIIYNGTGGQHQTNFLFANTANARNVTFQDATGTVAFLSDIPSGSPSALTATPDTNVTITLGGTPSTALLQATSITLGWTGQLSATRGGTGVNNGANTATYAGNLNFASSFTTSGAFAVTQTYTGATNVTFPTSGTLATTTGSLTSIITDSGTATVSSGSITVSGSSTGLTTSGSGSTVNLGGILNVAHGGTGVALFVPNVLVAGNTTSTGNLVSIPAGVGTSGQLLQSGGTGATPGWTTAIYPTSTTVNQLLYSSSANTITGLATANSSVLVTDSGGVPSLSTTLPSGIAATNMALTTPKVITSINDTNGNIILGIVPVASAVNYVSIRNNATGGGVRVQAIGSDTNVDLNLIAQAAGAVNLLTTRSTNAIVYYTGTANQHITTHNFTDSAATRTVTWPDTDIACFVVQRVSTQTGAVATGTTTIPLDDTIPQNTEGDQYMSLSITPKSASNILKIEVTLFASCSVSATIQAALFQDSTANALAAGCNRSGSSAILFGIKFTHTMTAGTTSSTTFKVRCGIDTAGTTTFNGVSGGRIYGGVMASSLIITEFSS